MVQSPAKPVRSRRCPATVMPPGSLPRGDESCRLVRADASSSEEGRLVSVPAGCRGGRTSSSTTRRRMIMRFRSRSLLVRSRSLPAMAAIAFLAACGSSQPTTGNSTTGNSTTGNSTTGNSTTGSPTTGSPTAAADSFPTKIAAANGTVHIGSRNPAIISMSPTVTEMLYAIGAGSQVKAVDGDSDYPPQAPKTKLSGFQPNIEAIIADHPDLVVVSGDTGGLTKHLAAFKIPVLELPAAARLSDVYAQFDELGRATGHLA